MTESQLQIIGQLQSDAKNTKADVEKLFASNTKRKDENTENAFNLQSILHTVEETNTLVNGLATGMEEIREKVNSIDDKMVHMDSRINSLEDRQFDWSKFMSGLMTAKGMALVTIVCVTAFGFGILFFSPEDLPQFLDKVSAKK